MRTFKRLFALCLCVTVAFLAVSCTNRVAIEEIEGLLPELVENSKVLNEIYFGSGFEIDGEHSDVETNGGYFCCDTAESEFHSVLEIKEATEKVFTKEYAEILYKSAFDGLVSEGVVKSPRFMETEDGLMQKVNDVKYELPDREFDFDSLTEVKSNSKRIIVTVDTFVDGEKDDTLTLIVSRVKQNGETVYRLDSPTY